MYRQLSSSNPIFRAMYMLSISYKYMHIHVLNTNMYTCFIISSWQINCFIRTVASTRVSIFVSPVTSGTHDKGITQPCCTQNGQNFIVLSVLSAKGLTGIGSICDIGLKFYCMFNDKAQTGKNLHSMQYLQQLTNVT